MSLPEPDQVSWFIVFAKPYIVGGLGALATFLHAVIEDRRTLNYAFLVFWVCIGALFASWADESLTWAVQRYEITIPLRGPLLFFVGGGAIEAYPKLRDAGTDLLVGLADRVKAFVEKLK